MNQVHLPDDELEVISRDARRELEEISPLFYSIAKPRTAINWGYMIYLEEAGHLYPGIRRVIESHNELLQQFKEYPRAHFYITECLRVGIDYARSLKRAIESREDARDRANDWRRLIEKNEISTATRDGAIRMGIKLGLTAVTTFAAIKLFYPFFAAIGVDPHMLDELSHRSSPSPWAAIFGAGIATLLSIWKEMGRIRNMERSLLLQYHLRLQEAAVDYGQDRIRALKGAYYAMSKVHEQLLGTAAPDEAESLADILALTHPDIEEAKREIEYLKRNLKDSPWKKLRRFVSRSEPITRTMAK